jgi:uncharacterized protein (DUF983 family)
VTAAPPLDRGRLLRRGVARRCPVCGGGGLFRRWFEMVERCPRCAFRFERIEGHWLGSLGMNTIVSFTMLFVVLLVGFVVTWPDPPTGPLIMAGVVTAVVVPLLFFPFSRTIWTAIDLAMRPLSEKERAEITHDPQNP